MIDFKSICLARQTIRVAGFSGQYLRTRQCSQVKNNQLHLSSLGRQKNRTDFKSIIFYIVRVKVHSILKNTKNILTSVVSKTSWPINSDLSSADWKFCCCHELDPSDVNLLDSVSVNFNNQISFLRSLASCHGPMPK